MVAESDPVRRPALPVPERTAARQTNRRRPLRVCAFLLGLLTVAGAVLLPALSSEPARAASTPTAEVAAVPAATSDAVGVDVTPTTSDQLRPDQDLQLTVTITNATSNAIPAGTVDLYLAKRALTSRTAVESWLRPDDAGDPGDLLLSSPTTANIPAGDTLSMALTVPSGSVGLSARNAWGARGIAATLTTDDTVRAEGRGTFIWFLDDSDNPVKPVTPVNLAVAIPITTPEDSTGLIAARALEAFTGADGLLTRQLDDVIDRPVAIAIDPMIIASIRILGSAAPASALAWLDRLAGATNEIFPLSYADADIALQAQAGASTLLEPISFEQALDPSLFTTPTNAPGGISETPSDNPSATPTPTPTPGGATLPTSAELLAWNYTMTDVGWPKTGTVARSDLDVFAASGLSTTILGGTNVDEGDSETPNAVVPIADGTGLVSDDDISAAIHRAAHATTDGAWREAVAEASSLLAVVSAEDPGTTRTLLATFDRDWSNGSSRLGETLEALAALPWEAPASLRTARDAKPAADVTFQSQAEPDDRVEPARQLVQREADVTAFSTALANPIKLTGSHRLALLALLATSWTEQPGAWQERVSASLTESRNILDAVTVTTRGPINVAADKVDFPITLRNELGQAVTVRVQVVPSNGRLLVGSDIETTIDANSAHTMTIPVTAAVGNGEVALQVTMFTAGGVAVGSPAVIDVNVHADWEGIGAWVVASIAILFFGFGIWRNILRRRRERGASVADRATPDTDITAPSEPTAVKRAYPESGPSDSTPPPPTTSAPNPAADPRG